MLADLTTRCMPGPPYGSISTGRLVPGVCQEGNSTAVRDAGRPGLDQVRRRVRQVRLLARTRRRPRCERRRARCGPRAWLLSSVRLRQHGRAARGHGGVHARLGRDRGQPARPVPPDAVLGGLASPPRTARRPRRCRATARTCRPAGVTGAAAASAAAGGDDEAAGVAADPGPHDVAVGQLRGHAVDDVGPVRVAVLADHLAGARVDDPHGLLVAGLHDDQQVLAPGRVDQVREGGPVPAGHLGQLDPGRRYDGQRRLGAVHGVVGRGREGGDEQGHVRVRGPRGRVADLGRGLVRVGRVGDVPPGHRGTRPPGPPGAWSRPATTSSRGSGPSPRPATNSARPNVTPSSRATTVSSPRGQVDDAQRALVHVGDRGPGRVGPGFERRDLSRDAPDGRAGPGPRHPAAPRTPGRTARRPPAWRRGRWRRPRSRRPAPWLARGGRAPAAAGSPRPRPAPSGRRPAAPRRWRRRPPTGRSPGRRPPVSAGTGPCRRPAIPGTPGAPRAGTGASARAAWESFRSCHQMMPYPLGGRPPGAR